MQAALAAAGDFESHQPLLLAPPPAATPERLLELLQQAAIEASQACGFSSEWYRSHDLAWWIRRTALHCFAPPHSTAKQARARIRTVCRTRGPARSEREYRILLSPGEQLLASARTEWILVDRASGRPLRGSGDQPGSAAAATVDAAAPRSNHPPRLGVAPALPTTPPTRVGTRRIVARDLDSLGHVNNTRYAAFAMAAVHSAWPDAPPPPALRVLSLDLTYLRPTYLGDQLDLLTWLAPALPTALPGGGQTRSAEILLTRGPQPVARILGVWSAPPPSAGGAS